MTISAAYATVAMLWIVYSDRLAAALAESTLHLTALQTYKGWIFVAVTTALLLLLLRRSRRIEDALRTRVESQARQYRTLFEANPLPMWVYDLDSLAFLAVNDAAVASYGYRRDEFLAMSIADIRPAQDVPALLRNVAGVSEGLDHAGTWRHVRKNGETIEVEITSSTLSFEGRRAGLVLAKDVTAQRTAQRRMAEAEERLRLALDAARQGLYDLDLRTGEARINDAYGEMLGYAPGELVETNAALLARLHPEDRDRVGRTYADYVAGRLPDYRVEFRQRTKQGNWKWILSVGRIMERDGSGTPLRILGTHTDIDIEKQAQARVRRLANLYAALSQCNQAIARTGDRDELLREICRVAVDFGGLRMAWIGELRDGRVFPVASFGARTDYVASAGISIDPAEAAGRGPTAVALREQRRIVCDDIEGDPAMAPWRERALECGFRASAACPLQSGGQLWGTLNLYAPEARFFDAELVSLLDEMATDISFALDRFRLEAQSQAAEQRFRTLTDHAADAIFIADLDGRILDANAWACETLGYTRDELLAMDVTKLDLKASELGIEEVRRILAACFDQRQTVLGLHRRKDGSTFPVEVRIAGMHLPGGDYVIGMARDIDERLRAEQALKESEQRFRRISQAISDIVYSCRRDADGAFEIDWMLGAVERITGFTPEDLMARRCWRCLVVPEDQGLFEQRVIGLAPGSSGSCELRLQRKDGGIVWVNSVAECAADGEAPAVHRLYGGLIDISERKTADVERERLLAAAQAERLRFQQLVERITDGFVALDRDWRYVFVNEQAAQVLQRRAEDLVGRHIWTEFPMAVGQPFQHAVEKAVAEQTAVTMEDFVPAWDRWLENRIFPSPEGVSVLFQDITQRKLSARRLAQSEERFRTLMELLPHGVQENDLDGRITFANPALERISAAAPGSLLGRTIWDMLAREEDIRALREYFVHLVHTQPPPELYIGRNRRDDGSEADVLVDWTYRRDSEGRLTGFISVVTDITERKRAEKAMAEYAERLQSLSRRLLAVQEEERRALARELHDEIGQQLAALKLNLTVLLRAAGPGPDPRRITDCIEIADLTIERIRDAALNLRPSVLDDLGLTSALHWYARRQAQRAGCDIEVRAAVPPLPGDVETALFRIAQEAVNNAIRHGHARRIELAVSMAEHVVRLRIEDDGTGFDPTAASGEGMGLLGMRERSELLGGNVALDSRPGAGTRLTAEIPLDLSVT